MALRLSVKLTAGNPPSGASLHIQDQRVGDGYMAADGEFPLQQPKRTTAATPAMHRGAIMKMYDRQWSIKSFEGLREKTQALK